MGAFIQNLEPRVLLAGEPKFITPIAGTAYTDWALNSYVDLNPAVGVVTDYKGGKIASDGHNGIDFVLPSFGAMDAGVNVLAAASGTVTYVHDGEFDRQSVNPNPSAFANEITIDHGNGWQSIYLQLRNGSVKVTVGQQVTAGQVIAQVGSSGYSSGPNLHFEVHHNGQVVETYQNPSTFWTTPLTYAGDAPFNVLDSAVTNYNPLGSEERPESVTTFSSSVANQQVWLWGAFQGLKSSDVLTFNFYKPDTTLLTTLSGNASNASFGKYAAGAVIPSGAPVGTWHAKLLVNNVQVLDKTFTVNGASSAQESVYDGQTYLVDGRTSATDFGTAFTGQTISKTFTILNHGSATLNITGVDVPAGFVVTSNPAASVAIGQTTTFTVKLDNLAAQGAKSGNIVVHSNDPEDANYKFAVIGAIGGATPVGAIRGQVFNDQNADGFRQAGEPGILSWGVFLDTNNNGTKDAGEQSTTADSAGRYSFANLAAGTYHIKPIVVSGFRKTQPIKGVSGFDVNVVTGQTTVAPHIMGTTNVYVAGHVFDDVNSDGIWEDDVENELTGVTIKILSNNIVVATRVSDANGFWKVNGLSAGSGELTVVLPAGKTITWPAAGKYVGSMSSGEQNANLNFGLHQTSPAPAPFNSNDSVLASTKKDSLIDLLL